MIKLMMSVRMMNCGFQSNNVIDGITLKQKIGRKTKAQFAPTTSSATNEPISHYMLNKSVKRKQNNPYITTASVFVAFARH